MADEIIDQILFQKGFNHAYYLQKDTDKGQTYLKELEGRNNSKSYGLGLKKGKQEAKREIFIEEMKVVTTKKEKGLDR